MSTRAFFILGVFLWTITRGQRFQEDTGLGRFLLTLEQYTHTKNDVVFLIGEWTSIGDYRFHLFKQFSKLIAQRFSVTAEKTRVAVVTFSMGSRTHIDYVKDSHGKNMCTLLKEIDDIAYSGGEGMATDKAMEAAEDILAAARNDSEKIILLLDARESYSGHSPVAVSNRLKQMGITIFVVAVAGVHAREINAIVSSPRHICILPSLLYINSLNLYLQIDARDDTMSLARDRSDCNALCSADWDCCDTHAQCYCGTRTGRYSCECKPGYHGIGTHCHKCPKATYKSESLNGECTACPAHSTTEEEGSTHSMNCTCDPGYQIVEHTCRQCPKGTYKSESLNGECTACPVHSTTEEEGSTHPMNCTCEPGYQIVEDTCQRIMVH